MSDTVFKRASFWRETMRELLVFAKAEWQWIVIFASVFAIEQSVSFSGDFQNISGRLLHEQGNAAKYMETINGYLPAVLSSAALSIATVVVAAYVFTILYLRQTMREKAPEFSISNFLFWLWKMFQKGLILYLPLLLILVVFVFMAAPTPSESVSGFINMFVLMGTDEGALTIADKGLSALGTANLILLLAGNVWFFYFYFCLYLFYLVAPLAALRQEPVFKTSAKMAKKDLLRIWWESMIIFGILFVVLLPLMAVNLEIVSVSGAASPYARVMSALVSGIWEALSSVSMSVYAVVVYRILSKEQKTSGSKLN
jgi:hypothetical protein